ncbi:MAG: OmpA family protein [Deltaproteobacteria bacterium]|nr:OmpA family protein [Deltaproteobacteria bacterium]
MKLPVRSLIASSFALLVAACCPKTIVAEPPPPPPDRDGDGIIDAEDQCPDVAGVASFGGCLDTDGDGMPDNTDQCPEEAGVVEHRGCKPPPPPDTDGDGVIDAEDSCPSEAGSKRTKGCPDRDRDGIADASDKCPDQAGSAAFEGCLPPALQKFSGSIKGITFDAGKATIRKASHKTLDEAVKALQEFPELRLEIQGHTDDQGPDDTNMTLSQARADSVKAYFESKGVDAARVVAKGFGESQPVADNKTAAGRAKNRRIEFKILGQD